MFPQFAKVHEVILVKYCTCVMLSMQVYHTVYFDAHYNSFVVNPSGSFMYTTTDNLAYYRPLSVRKSFDVFNKKIF